MKKGIPLLILFSLAVGFSLMGAPPKPSAQPQGGSAGCTVPKTFGTYRGSATTNSGTFAVVFEDAAGTLRFIDASPCVSGQPRVVFQIERQ